MSKLIHNDVTNKKENIIEELFSEINKITQPKKVPWIKEQQGASSCEEIVKCCELIKRLHSIQCSRDDVFISINRDFQHVTLMCENSQEGPQYVKVKCLSDGNYTICDHSLPELEGLQGQFMDIQQVVNIFQECLCELSEYFDTMADLDNCCWIIDPSVPTSKDNFRRIVIGNNVSILVTVDCRNSRDMPSVNVLGPSVAVESLSHKIHEYSERWSTDLPLTSNLLNMLDFSEFPSKPQVCDNIMDEPMEVECCICFSNRDSTGCLPNVVCENSHCGQNFHGVCLYQWLSTTSSNVQTFNTIHGECPSCLRPISCPVGDIN